MTHRTLATCCLLVLPVLSKAAEPAAGDLRILDGSPTRIFFTGNPHHPVDDRHYSDAGKDYMGCLWFEALLKHDGLAATPWLRQEIEALVKAGKP